ncbi:hypothetical protein BD324DRAFT_266258 [Kockovaella imperatae]|uniref:Uncharacterized protein n=1 Tax=Kockovaella imperatae TaxID=4999 RepID=A0A1Y1UQ96_9TREE|nr:hypothetical protein BD324DRAFT_266258 [Kockovaella imperatae]ORX40211.1 hypothetical protein BD324DRAFT_266258 [Kockovaella imperatae]
MGPALPRAAQVVVKCISHSLVYPLQRACHQEIVWRARVASSLVVPRCCPFRPRSLPRSRGHTNVSHDLIVGPWPSAKHSAASRTLDAVPRKLHTFWRAGHFGPALRRQPHLRYNQADNVTDRSFPLAPHSCLSKQLGFDLTSSCAPCQCGDFELGRGVWDPYGAASSRFGREL